MKTGFNSLILFLCSVLCCKEAYAKLGWQWGSTYTSYYMFTNHSTAVDTAGSIFVAGQDFKSVGGIDEFLVVKTDSAGNYKWSMAAAGTRHSAALSVVASKHGYLYILGAYTDTICILGADTLRNSGKTGMYFLVKCSIATGGIVWLKNIVNNSVSGTSSYIANGKLGVDDSGNVFIAGSFGMKQVKIDTVNLVNTDTSGTHADVFIAKYTSAGSFVWARSFGGTKDELSTDNNPLGFTVTRTGNLYIAGRYESSTMTIGTKTLINPSNKPYNYLVKYDKKGNVLWVKGYGNHLTFEGLLTDWEENLFVTGHMDSIVTIGTTVLVDSAGGSVAIAKYDSTGGVLWARSSSGLMGGMGQWLSIDNCGNLWVSGKMGNYISVAASDTLFFSGNKIVAPSGNFYPMFLVRYDTLGNYQEGFSMGSGGSDIRSNYSTYFSVDNIGNLCLGGSYTNSKMVMGPDTLAAVGGTMQMYVGKYKYDTVFCNEHLIIPDPGLTGVPAIIQDSRTINLFPDPASKDYTIMCSKVFEKGTTSELYDISGKLINTTALSGCSIVISLDGVAPGMYICRIIGGHRQETVKKLVVMK